MTLVRRHTLAPITAALAGLLLATALTGCSSSSAAEPETPVTLTPIDGTERFQVTLTEQANTRLGIVTAPVRQAKVTVAGSAATDHKVVAYAAVIYDSEGKTWAYTPSNGLTYTRVPITVATIEGADAVLDDGPAVGTLVVVVGAPELLGAEAQIAGEE